ncbi:hypothetical protein CC2G_001975 [Coprinopsis cinerea AmutBmut pab1-1]|nr:hypothetical protein CC2G_001975 [Coprinopsis cinerea AmutBmut pab1-1]
MQPQHQPPHIQQPNPIQPQPSLPPPVPQTPTSSSSSLMGATNGDRIQLAPLRSGSSGHASSASGPPSTGAGSPVLPLSSPVAVTNGHHTPQQQQQNGYVMSPVRSNSRDGYGPSVTPPSRERDDRSGGRESSRESDGRKKNPLAINSIISDDHTR